MIKLDDKILTPKQAAKKIIEDGLAQSLTTWETDTWPGQQLDEVITDRERELINNHKSLLLRRILKILS
tara:strand:+ start:1308 stop:1514 length:207 start_codon:yes stop_codon:yes gene_type:complete